MNMRQEARGEGREAGGRGQLRCSRLSPLAARLAGFTLIELMVVVGILGIIMTIAIPSIYHSLHQDSMRKAVSDVMEACSKDRKSVV